MGERGQGADNSIDLRMPGIRSHQDPHQLSAAAIFVALAVESHCDTWQIHISIV
jgi:hypothetical protein